MIIVNFKGGLGNQLFQYALYKKLQILGKDVFADNYLYSTKLEMRQFLLPEICPPIKVIDEKTAALYRGNPTSIWGLICRKYHLLPKYFRDYEMKYYNEIFSYDDIYLDGYWQSERFFDDIKKDIVESIHFPELQGINHSYLQQIQQTNAVSIHVRRGDYVLAKGIYGDIYEDGYYTRALEYIKKRVTDPMFFVFSDDIEWAKEVFNGEAFCIVQSNSLGKEYVDMKLMSECKYNIIANSSFSWWGAWLNDNEDKMVIAPEKWLRKKKVSDIWCDSWIRL